MAKTLFARGSDGKVAIFEGGAPTTATFNNLKSAYNWYDSNGNIGSSGLATGHVFIAYGNDISLSAPAPTDANNAQRIHVRFTEANGSVINRYLVLPAAARASDVFIKALPLEPGDVLENSTPMLQYATGYDKFTNPVANLGDIYFHSDLGYIGNSTVITANAAHPVRTRSTSTSKRLFGTDTWNNPVTGEQDYAIGTHSFGTANVPFICKIGNNQAPAGTVIQQVGQSVRVVFPYITSTHVRVKEQFITFNDSLPAYNQSYKFYLFNTLFTASGSTSISASGSNFTAGFGKLNSSFRYHRKTSSSPDFFVTAGATADVNTGAIKIVMPDGTTTTDTAYAGSFTGTTSTGIKI